MDLTGVTNKDTVWIPKEKCESSLELSNLLPLPVSYFVVNEEMQNKFSKAPTATMIDLFDPTYESVSRVIYQQYSDLIHDGSEWRKLPHLEGYLILDRFKGL